MFSTAAVALKCVFRKIICDRTGSRDSLKRAADTEIFFLGGKAGAMSRRKSAGHATLDDAQFVSNVEAQQRITTITKAWSYAEYMKNVPENTKKNFPMILCSF